MRPQACFAVSLALPLAAQIAPPNEVGVSMGHLHVLTTDPEAHRRLWVDALGGQAVKLGPLDFALFPGVIVGFREADSAGGTDGSVVDHLGFLVRDLAAAKARLRAAGAEIIRETPESRQLFAMFPGGVKVEFTEDAGLDAPIKHHHIHFATHELEEMRAWYVKVFGAKPGMRGRFQAADLPGANLSWNASAQPTAPTKGRTLDHIGFEVRDIKAFCKKLQGAGITLDMPPTARPEFGLTIAFLTDPWGTRIELTEGLDRLR